MFGRLRRMDFNGTCLLFLINEVSGSICVAKKNPLLVVIVLASYDTDTMLNFSNILKRYNYPNSCNSLLILAHVGFDK